MPDHTEPDTLLSDLAALAEPAPDRVRDRVIAHWTRQPSVIGDVDIAYTDHGVAYLRPTELGSLAEEFKARFARPLVRTDHPPAAIARALADGDGTGLEFDLTGLTAFQASVLHAAQRITKGTVQPYAWIAEHIDNPRAVRAVGTALGHNPVPLLIPCHRVVKADLTAGQYIFGVEAKLALLHHEGVRIAA